MLVNQVDGAKEHSGALHMYRDAVRSRICEYVDEALRPLDGHVHIKGKGSKRAQGWCMPVVSTFRTSAQ
jgi:hypothetical protein